MTKFYSLLVVCLAIVTGQVAAQASSVVSKRSLTSGEVSVLGTATVGAKIYTDRPYRIKSLSPILEGAELISFANDEKSNDKEQFLSFVLSQRSLVFVAYDNRSNGLPVWMEGWEKTVADGMSGRDHYNIFVKEFGPGLVRLGGNQYGRSNGAETQYVVFIKPVNDALLAELAKMQQHVAESVRTKRVYLSGKGKSDPVQWDFFCTEGRKSGEWTTIGVPSNWELQGFGNYNYGHDGNKQKEQGLYRREFSLAPEMQGKVIKIVFEGSMTDTEVRVNGLLAGKIHQGGFYQFEYDITELVHWDQPNLLEVTVSKVSADHSVEVAERRADYWVFGGIYRPVYLKVLPREYIDWTAIDAQANGRFNIKVYTSMLERANRIVVQLFDAQGDVFGKPIVRSATNKLYVKDQMALDEFLISGKVSGHKLWSGESPNLYTMEIALCAGEEVLHSVTERFGFRTFEVRDGDGLYLNDQRIMLKGSNRHSFWPDSGRTLSREIVYDDAHMIKAMNMNAVRMSHYPPEKEFLEACDELGLYVINELNTWCAPSYSTAAGEPLVASMVKRDVNHPSIVLWANGNEGGWNVELDDDFEHYDIQRRRVIHPWADFNGLETDHYEHYNSMKNRKLAGPSLGLPTEFLHGLYDGGHGAGLEDYWKLFCESPFSAGGFLWALVDEGVVRTDKDGWIDTDGQHAPDGIVGPYREKEGSYYTIKEIWSHVLVPMETLPADFDGTIPVINNYDFTDLDAITFKWQLSKCALDSASPVGSVNEPQGELQGPTLAAGESGELHLDLPENFRDYTVLTVEAFNWEGDDIWKWSWPLVSNQDYLQRNGLAQESKGAVEKSQQGDRVTFEVGQFTYTFNAKSGLLETVSIDGQTLPLTNGPRLVATDVSSESVGEVIVTYTGIRANDTNGLDAFEWKVTDDGALHLSYRYALPKAEYEFHGVSFDCDETTMEAFTYLGQGPFRVWKNRLKGGWLDIFERGYNQGIAGENWILPEFAGFYKDVFWCDLKTQAGIIGIRLPENNQYLRIGELRSGGEPKKSIVTNPVGDLSFMHGINPIGTKFYHPRHLGPMSQPNPGGEVYEGHVVFEFKQ